MRLVANNGCALHLIEPMGFDLDEKKLRRAGLDYRDIDNTTIHKDFVSFYQAMNGRNIYALTTRGSRPYTDVSYQPGDVLLFGAETHGLSEQAHAMIPEEYKLRIPMRENNRSMNLSNTVALVSYEAWRQHGFDGGQ
jgi:tRNA (cytidine/uridine-2'-O-)-methyltransferase